MVNLDLINKQVEHKSFGKGIITEFIEGYITVKFSNGDKNFVFPDIFNSFLKIYDTITAQGIEILLKEKVERTLRIKNEQELQSQLRQGKPNHSYTTNPNKKCPKFNVAFKCNFCDGGRNETQIGYNGVCSEEIIEFNIEQAHHTWCCSENSACFRYLNNDISREELENMCNDESFICYESQMLRDWRAFAGVTQTGENKGRPMKLNKVQNNSLAVLTTRNPDFSEIQRYVFAVFLVDETYEGDNKDAGYVTTNSKYKIKLSQDEAEKIKFWNYYFNANATDDLSWGHGLHRYLTDEQSAQILKDVVKVKATTKDAALAVEFLKYFCKINGMDDNNIPEPNGGLLRK